jgi:hypothetical protein
MVFLGCSAGIIAIDLAKRLLQVRTSLLYAPEHMHADPLTDTDCPRN